MTFCHNKKHSLDEKDSPLRLSYFKKKCYYLVISAFFDAVVQPLE